MSQSKVKDFFTLRKGNRDLQPSKRRKLDADNDEVIAKKGVSSPQSQQIVDNKDKLNKVAEVGLTLKSSTSVLSSTKLSKTRAQTQMRSTRARKPKSVIPSKGQKKLDFKVAKDLSASSASKAELEKSHSGVEPGEEFVTETCPEEVTYWDDHMNQECTPRKRILSEMDSLSQGPKARVRKSAARRLDHDSGAASSSPPHGVKKKLELEGNAKDEAEAAPIEIAQKSKCDDTASKCTDGSSGKAEILNLVTEMSDVQGAISPLALTPEHSSSPDPTPTTITPKLHDLSEKLKVLSKMDGQALKNRLKKKGILGEVKGKLDELSKANADNKMAKSAESVSEEKAETKLPAHQRFDYLVKEGPPTLTLPYTYRLLENAFQAMDTVVSMLHNRSEVCTFDKLQSSVQNMTKKNFQQKTAGQIKTVVPDAYTFKQEKVPVYGQRTSPYFLTVEANLRDNDGDANKNVTKDGKIPFTASVLLRRKTLFKANLLKILKKHHKTFLESLTPPLRIPDDKLSRWHPKFALDKVPDILISNLPQPPNLQVYRSAKDVLEMQVGKLNPRLQKALSKVVSESNDAKTKSEQPNDTTCKANNSSPLSKEALSPSTGKSSKVMSSSPSTPSQSSMKGIPPALLAKIRAKEALKMEQALTRDPAEDRRIRMLGHLPEIIRILRSYFVTEKRPALPLENVIKKLGDSYHTGLSQGEIEQHIKLLKETAPELLSIVEIKRGKFVKLDKNVDISAIADRINNIVKASK